MTNIAIIVGSIRKDSSNLKLAKAFEKLGAGKFTVTHVRIDDLPLFNQDLESNVPASVVRLKKEIEGADGVLFITPEYNRSIPGVLKNAIDWASRPYGSNSFGGKPAAVAGTSPGAIGTAVAQAHLRSILAGFLDMPLMGQPELYLAFKDGLIDAEGTISNPDTQKFLQGFVDKFAAHVGASAKAKAAA